MGISYSIGKIFKISEGSGLDSGKLVTVIPWFYWKEATDGTYREMDSRHYVAVKYETGEKGFCAKSHLIPMTKESIFDDRL